MCGEQLDVLECAGDAQLGDPVGPLSQDALSLPPNLALLRSVDTVEASLKIDVFPAPFGPMIANSSSVVHVKDSH